MLGSVVGYVDDVLVGIFLCSLNHMYMYTVQQL